MRSGTVFKILLFLCIAASVYFLATRLVIKPKSTVSNSPGNQKAGKPTLKGVIVNAEKFSTAVRATGSIMAYDEVELKAETSGRIIKIYFLEGSHVAKGDLLIKIYDEDLKAQLQKINLQVKLLEDQEARQKKLFELNATSREEYDIILNQLNTLKADRELILTSLSKTEIRAPFSGIIGLRYVSEGSYVTPASRIASVQNINPVKIDFTIPEKYAGKIAVGEEFSFRTEENNRIHKGKIYAIEPKIDPSTRSLQVRALSYNSNELLIPGAFIRIELPLRQQDNAILIPTQAVIPVLKGQKVFLYKDGLAKSFEIKTENRTEDRIQVTEGISPGDTLIITGIMSLKPDMPVNIIVN